MHQPSVTRLAPNSSGATPCRSGRPGAADGRLLAMLLAALVGANASPAQESNSSGVTLASRVDVRAVQPRLTDSLTGDLRWHLKLAFHVALGTVRRSPQCAALFTAYGADGVAALASSRYTFAGRLC